MKKVYEMNGWVMAAVGTTAFVGGCFILRACWGQISVSDEVSDEERAAVEASDKRQEQFRQTGAYFPPEN